MVPRTQYVRSTDDVSIAFQVLGDGPVDVLFVPGLISHIEHIWEEPGLARYMDRIASFCRLILMDRRGTGLSDPMPGTPEMDDEVADLDAVLEAAGCERAALLAYSSGGPLAIKYAAERGERTRALVLYATFARASRAPGYDWTYSAEERAARIGRILEGWGEGRMIEEAAPTAAGDPRMHSWFARMERLSASPGTMAVTFRNLGNVDVRGLLSRVTAPTLVLHRTDDRLLDVRHSRYLAEHIPGARLVELPGVDNMPSVGDADALVDEIETFLTGGRRAREPERALLTVLFTDIVAGTRRVFEIGDARWRDLLAAHDAAVRRQLAIGGGREIKTIGDGFLATFEGPPSAAVRCARAIVAATAELGVEIRAGLHTGECELIGDDVGGMAVHVAARVADLAQSGEVLVSSTLRQAVAGSGVRFEPRGQHELRGVPGTWPLYAAAA